MNGRRCIACLALAALIPVSGLRAQVPLDIGTRVRVTAPAIAEEPIAGVVSSADSASITLAVPGEADGFERTIPIASVRRLEIYRGRSHSPVEGMGTGLLWGAGIGLAIGIGAAAGDDPWVCQGGECLVYGTLSGAFWGTVLGGLFGAAIGHDEWGDVILVRPTVAVRPDAGGFALAVSLRF